MSSAPWLLIDPWGVQVRLIMDAMRRVYGDHNVEAVIAGHLVLGTP